MGEGAGGRCRLASRMTTDYLANTRGRLIGRWGCRFVARLNVDWLLCRKYRFASRLVI